MASKKSAAQPRGARPPVETPSSRTKRRASPRSGARPSRSEELQPDATHAWRHQTLGRLLHFVLHAFEARMIASYHHSGFSDVRQVHLNALRHIDYGEGTRIVDIAARAGVTKGAMGQLVEECRRLGLVELSVDDDDRRAKIVRFSERGRRVMTATKRAAQSIEADFAEMLGAERFAHLREDLAALRAQIVAADSLAS